jgi:murein DD-endopeptidase MepM/ murein hydrolase activator NlpD
MFSTPSDSAIASRPAPDAARAEVTALAQQFEAMLLTQMLRELRTLEDEDGEGLGGSVMADTMNAELGLALSRAGGLGLVRVLTEAFGRIVDPPSRSVNIPAIESLPVELPGVSAVPPASTVAPTSAVASALPSPVTSAFGWRADPITGQRRFHAGIDLRMAYGEDVRSAGGGVVRSVGEQSGYGLTVVVDHGRGLETRYAHLSSTDVRVGDAIAAGQVIARSGNSGRTTGAHLHFEVRADGRAVDPRTLAHRLTVPVEAD